MSTTNSADSSDMLKESVRPYFKDYIINPSPYGYESLHITLYDNESRSYVEVQLRTKDMDDYAEIGPANHLGYEKSSKKSELKETRFLRENVSFLMKPSREECCSNS